MSYFEDDEGKQVFIWPINDDDRWAVIASLRARYKVSYRELLGYLQEAERAARGHEWAKEIEEGSRVVWRVILAELTEKLL